MYSRLRYVNITVQVPDGRILLYRKYRGGTAQWAATREKLLIGKDDPLVEINKILWDVFGINPNAYTDNFAEIKQLPAVKILPNRHLHLYTVKMKSSLAFCADAVDQYHPMMWSDIVDDVSVNSHHPPTGYFPKHTPTAIIAIKELQLSKVF